MKKTYVYFFLLIIFFGTNSAFSQSNALDFTKAAESSMHSVVHIKSKIKMTYNNPFGDFNNQLKQFFGDDFDFFNFNNKQMQDASGSGIIFRQDGYIMTNFHVIDKAESIEITLNDNRTYPAEIIATDPSTDLALLKINETNLPEIKFANSEKVKVGEWVLAVGNPFNLNSTVTAGIVSAKARNINIIKNNSAVESFIQTDAAVNPGNSGGALVNLQGELIGINTAIASPTGAYAGYSFAVPANLVKKVITDLLEFGEVKRGYLGISVLPVKTSLVEEKQLQVNQGIYIEKVFDESGAKDAGINEGDVIVNIDGKPLTSYPQLQEVVGEHRPGDKLKVKINRGGKVMDFLVELKDKSAYSKALVTGKSNNILDKLGIEFEGMETDEYEDEDLEKGIRVTKVLDGKIKSFTEVKAGFIITKVNRIRVKTVEEFDQALSKSSDYITIEGKYDGIPEFYSYSFSL